MIYSTIIDGQEITIDSGNKCISKKVLRALTQNNIKLNETVTIAIGANHSELKTNNVLAMSKSTENGFTASIIYKGCLTYTLINTYSKTLEALHQYA